MLSSFVTLNPDNGADEHICCAISDKVCSEGYAKKKAWLSSEFENGYRFVKLDVRGKVFIEYVPIEHSWLPLVGEGYTVINCFWVSGRFKKQGYGTSLLNTCLGDDNSTAGAVAITGDKKRPFMSDGKFLAANGFEVIDEAPPFFRLWGWRRDESVDYPRFADSARSGRCPDNGGITAYYSNTCPFTDHYTGDHLVGYAKQRGIPIDVHHLETRSQAQKMPIPWIINSVFYRGELVTLEMKADRHLDRVVESGRSG